MRINRPFIALLSILPITACATIMHGSQQEIGISSTPTNAIVSVDNQPRGNTPLVAKLSRKNVHIVKIELDGYQPFEATLTRKTSGWVWGNIVFGGLIGLAVDAISGGIYNLTPDQISAQLATMTGAASFTPTDGLYVVLVDCPDESWTRIGTLERE